jgi:hypothetical protein
MSSFWITESLTYKIYADSEEQAREIWNKYWCDGEDISTLDMWLKNSDVDADWDWARKECPNHAGAFDCTSFCSICGGNQEY